MAWWYNYDSVPVYKFELGVDGDVLRVPCGIQSVSWSFDNQPNSLFGAVLYIHGTDGGTQTLYTEGEYVNNIIFKHATDGWSSSSIALPGLYGTIKYDKDVNTFWGTGSSELYVQNDLAYNTDGSYSWNYNKRIYLSGEKGWQSYAGITDINAVTSTGSNELWGDWQNNRIVDGSGNSGLFGGWGGDDTLTGGDGADTFFVGHNGGGHDIITDAQSSDTVWLFNSNPWETNYYYDTVNNVMHIYAGSGELEVNCSTGDYWYPYTYPVYQFADGTRLTYEPSNNSFHGVSWDAAEDVAMSIADSPLWGTVNTFFGTDDADNFFLGKNDGTDEVFNAAQNDTIHLCDTALSDIIATSVNENVITVQFNTGETARVHTTENISPTFKLASGESYIYSRETSAWQEA